MDETYFRKIVTTVLLAVLVVLSFLLLKPILMSIILGFILAFIFTPIYDKLVKISKSKNLSVSLICIILILLIVIPFWFLVPIFINQSIKVYMAVQETDFVTPIKDFFPSLFASEEFSREVGSIVYSFVTKLANSLMNILSSLILNFPTIFLQMTVVFFTFFFTLRDHDKLVDYVKSLLPFSKDVEKKLIENTKGITSSVIYGQIVIGLVQGIILGAGFYLFGVSNALILLCLAVLLGILPIVGTAIVWVPVVIYLLIIENTFAAVGIIIFGLISSNIDNFLRPVIVSKRTSISPPVILIGMVGGIFFFGILGLILGPLILAYLLVFLEMYRDKKTPGLIIKE